MRPIPARRGTKHDGIQKLCPGCGKVKRMWYYGVTCNQKCAAAAYRRHLQHFGEATR